MPRKKKSPSAAAVAYGRGIRGWSQEELAVRLAEATGRKWSRDRVASIETGRSGLRLDDARTLAEVLRLPIETIAYGVGRGVSSRSGGDTAGYRRFAGAVQAVAA